MKYIIYTAILAIALSAGVASAQIFGYKTTQNDTFEQISNMLVDVDKVVVYKFKDGNTTCYGSYARIQNGNTKSVTAPSISCK